MVFSLTKAPLAASEIEALARRAFGGGARVVEARAAEGGMYNAGYHVSLAGSGPVRAFLKVAPPDGMERLTHERGLMRAEIETIGRLSEAGVGCAPAILAADTSRSVVDRDAVFLEHLDGEMLSEVGEALSPPERAILRRAIGTAAATIQSVTASRFGYPGSPALCAPTWGEAFGLMIGAVLDDAARLGVEPSLEWLRPRLAALVGLVEPTPAPRLVHYDLWDGNILVKGPHLAGLIDWERAFYGDPLAEIISLSFHNAMTPDPDVLDGWAGVAGALTLDAMAQARLALYRAYLWLIMLTEAGPRGFLDTQPPAKWAGIRRRLEADLIRAEAS